MESSSSTAFDPSNSSSQTLYQNSPSKHSLLFPLFNEKEISNSMSLHKHSTARRIFIGPTPTNWSYKKNSFFFSKSGYAKPNQIIIKQSLSNRGVNRNSLNLSKVIINKREKNETFVASRESTGPLNLSSLDLYEIVSKGQRNSVEIILEPKRLISESQNQTPVPDNTIKSDDHEIFYTPTDNVNTNPITPPKTDYGFPSPLKLDDDDIKPSTSQSSNVQIEDSNQLNDNENQNNTNLESRKVIDQEENNTNNNRPNYVRFSSSVAKAKPTYQPNTIIKQDSMLVRIDCEHHNTEEPFQKQFGHNFNHSVDWKELMVKLKPGVIELHKGKDKIIENINFTPTTKLSIFSSVDYTILITQPTKHCIKNFILNPKTMSSSIQWFKTLYELFPELVNKSIPNELEVVVPDLDVKLQIPLYNGDDDDDYEGGGGCGCDINEDDEDENESTSLNINPEEVVNVVLNELVDIAEWSDVLTKWLKSNNLRLCWKRYEKLEWIDLKSGSDEENVWNDLLKCPQFAEQTHQLQLRPIEHYPTTVKLNDGTKLTEPPPIEGYLIKITNNKGQNKKSKRLYFTSQNNYLFFLSPLKASPPPPPNVSTVATEEDGIQLCDNSQQHPLIYAISPYIQDKIIGNNNTFMKSDMKRRIKQIIHAMGFINLTEIVEIKYLKSDGKTEETPEENLREEEEDVNEGKGCLFKLLLKNGGIVSLKAYSKQTRKEWVDQLNELSKYWKARLKQDVRIRVDIIKENQSIYREKLRSHNWESNNTYVDPILWNWCILDGCRGITKSGLLYHRTHIRRPFQIYHHILTRGHFIYFNHHVRSTLTGCVLNRSYYKRKGCINLRDCYVYSGSITEYDYYKSNLLQEQSVAKSYNCGQFTKIYGDGMLSYDNFKDTSFVIWKSKRRYYFSNDGTKVNLEKRIKYDIPGKYWVFRTRSKIECEEWVWALNVEIERLHKEEEDN